MHAALTFLLLFLTAGAAVPVNRQFAQTADGIPVFVVSNGVHTDVVLPVQEPSTGTDWLAYLQQPGLRTRFADYRYAGFGWGSEGFYLASYGGRLPRVGTVLRALVPGPTLLHVDFYRQAPRPGKHVVALRVSAAEYQRLTQLIQSSFAADSLGAPQLRNAAGYTAEDFFFRARGRYHALRTCNDWTNRTLRQAGLRAALKAPLAGSVLHQVRRSAAPAELTQQAQP